jgi:SAM-dependent methyltransferase
VLLRVLRQVFSRRHGAPAEAAKIELSLAADTPCVLNVGGGSKNIQIPAHYNGWRHLLLDIDPRGGADLVCDARELLSQPSSLFDAVYCSHNLEHYYRHDAVRVLRGFLHVLKPDGFAEIRVPDIRLVMRAMLEQALDIDDVLYQSGVGPILVRDVIYGWHVEIERTGQDFYAHKTGFTSRSLHAILEHAGFAQVVSVPAIGVYEARAFAFKRAPTEAQRALLIASPDRLDRAAQDGKHAS